MKRFPARLLWLSLGCFGTMTAAAQEPSAPRPVTLYRPSPLASSVQAGRVVAETAPRPSIAPAFPAPAPIQPAFEVRTTGGVRQTSFLVPARAVRGLPEDEPKPFRLPKDIPAVDYPTAPLDMPAPGPGPKAPSATLPASAVQPALEGVKEPPDDIHIFVAPGSLPGPTGPLPALPLAPAGPAAPAAPVAVTPTRQPTPAQPISPETGIPGTDVFAAPYPSMAAPSGGVVDDPAVILGEDDGSGIGSFMSQGLAFGNPQRFYVRKEFLLWWTRGFALPPLVTTGPATVPEDFRGTPGIPGTTLLFGNSNTSTGPTSGGRFTAGYVLDPCGLCAIEGSFFFLGHQTGGFFADSASFPVLARPFFNVNTGNFDRELTASPGLLPADAFKLAGTISVNTFTDLQGFELNVRRQVCCGCNYFVNALAGFRYLDLHEGLSIQENVVSNQAVAGTTVFNPGNRFTVLDSFETRNRFYGGQLGLSGEYRVYNRFWVGANVKVALGDTRQTIDIFGTQVLQTTDGTRRSFPGGLLAEPSNIGRFSRDQFSVVPEVGIKAGYNLTNNLRVFVGYDFLYWSNVVRPGDQVDLAINVNQIPNFGNNPVFAPPSNQVRPAVPFRSTGFWAQGVNAGLELRY